MYDLKAIEKSRKLLIECMGQKNYDNFIENGKIEIKHKDLKDDNKDIVYELDQNARIYNRTTNESYCIEPLAPEDLPIHDQIALKYSYLKNNIKRVEEVANKRTIVNNIPNRYRQNDNNLIQEIGRTGRPDYSTYVEYMEGLGWMREQITLDEYNTRITTVNDVRADSTSSAIEIHALDGWIISFMGMHQVPIGADVRTAHAIRVRFANEDNREIPDDTRIRITKEKTYDSVIQLARIFYSDLNLTKRPDIYNNVENHENRYHGNDNNVNDNYDENADDIRTIFKRDDEWYRFTHGVELNNGESLKIYVIDPETNISSSSTKFAVDCDLWHNYI